MTTMDIANIEKATKFLEDASIQRIGDHPRGKQIKALGLTAPIDPKDDVKDVWVDTTGNVVFADAFDSQMKLDILYAWEFAQRYATTQIHKEFGPTDPSRQGADTIFTHSTQWYSIFTGTLRTLHWVIKDFDFSGVHAQGSTFEVDKIILDILSASLDESGTKAVQKAIDVMKNVGGDSPSMTLWNKHSTSAGMGSFQMGAVQSDPSGLPIMTTGAMQIDSKQENTDCFFFFHYSTSDTKMTQSSQKLIFNQDAYARKDSQGRSAREMVADKVAGSSTDFIADVGELE